MQITFLTNPRNGKRELVQIDDARITYKNFTGIGDKFNREGDRNFALIIPNEEIADELINEFMIEDKTKMPLLLQGQTIHYYYHIQEDLFKSSCCFVLHDLISKFCKNIFSS